VCLSCFLVFLYNVFEAVEIFLLFFLNFPKCFRSLFYVSFGRWRVEKSAGHDRPNRPPYRCKTGGEQSPATLMLGKDGSSSGERGVSPQTFLCWFLSL
jgi:hypothetical protein